MRCILCVVLIGVLLAPAAAVTIDGAVGTDYGAALAVQDTPTGFGDNFSELNAAYGFVDGSGNLALMLTGNLEGNGNGLIIFIDSRAGGAVNGSGVFGSVGGARIDDWGTDTDGGSGVSPTAGGSVLDLPFNPDAAIEINAGGGGANYFTNIIDLTLPNDSSNPAVPGNIDVFLGGNARNGSSVTQAYDRADNDVSKGEGGNITHAFDNSNTAGVTGASAAGALSATTGYEALFSSAFLANDGQPIRMLAFITNGGGDFLANQFLGEAGVAGAGNLGGPGGTGGTPLFDATTFVGNQFFTVPVIPEPTSLALVGLMMVFSPLVSRRRK